MSRKSARENAFKLVYEFIETGEKNDFTKEILCANNTPEDESFTSLIYNGVVENYDFIKSVIARYSRDFTYDRIYKTDLAALSVSVYELLCTDVPEKVSVNEALELSKIYSTDKSASFINGILASVIADKNQLSEELENDGKDN